MADGETRQKKFLRTVDSDEDPASSAPFFPPTFRHSQPLRTSPPPSDCDDDDISAPPDQGNNRSHFREQGDLASLPFGYRSPSDRNANRWLSAGGESDEGEWGASAFPSISAGKSACHTGAKKKKGLVDLFKQSKTHEEKNSSTAKSKTKKDPLPMKLRALPQSFWQQPNNACDVSPASVVPLLPPLVKDDISDDVTAGSPLTPSGETSRVLRVTNSDLLLKLFDSVEEKKAPPIVKRGRPKKIVNLASSRSSRGDDPCLVSAATEGILPFLKIDRGGGEGQQTSITLVSIGEGEKTVSLPALNVHHDYSQMLSELVVRL